MLPRSWSLFVCPAVAGTSQRARLCVGFLFALLLAGTSSAQVILTGITAWSSDSSGRSIGGGEFATGGSAQADAYVFTGSPESPTFLNSGDTAVSLNPNYSFHGGTLTLGFAGGATGYNHIGFNLFFNDQTVPGISAVAAVDGSSFSVISSLTHTVTLDTSANDFASGSLSFSFGGQTVTLSDYSVTEANVGVGYYENTGGGMNTVGSMTFAVTPVPEPATWTALAGLAALGATIVCRRRRRGA